MRRSLRLRRLAPGSEIDALRELDLHLYGRLLPWTADPEEALPIPAETSEMEQRMLFDLAARVWDGGGNVVELGTLFGASTQALGLGMAANPRREGRLFAVDAFLPYAPGSAARLEPLLGAHPDWPAIVAELPRGFLRAFEALHSRDRPYSPFLEVRTCLVPDRPANATDDLERVLEEAAPVGLAHVDSAKQWYAVRATFIALVRHLAPGALVAWQDHRWFNSFAIPYCNDRFGSAMELLAVVDSMHVYRYRGGLTPAAVAGEIPPAATDVAVDAFEELFERLARQAYVRNDAAGIVSATLQLAAARAEHGDREGALALVAAFRAVRGVRSHGELLDTAEKELRDRLDR